VADEPRAIDDLVIVRSRRRKRTAAIRERAGQVEVLLPAGLSADLERDLVDRLVGRLKRRRLRDDSDADLESRARRLSERYLEGRAQPTSVRFVDNMERRWGSATPATGTVRISRQLADVPTWVLEYVLLHELCHLVVDDHSRAFWRLLGRYPRAERARGYLLALAHPPRT
jgi:predicted metal-dependent hydrolase